MEAGSKTVVRTPLTQSILDKEGEPGIQQLTQEVPNAIFTPERGVPQGDTGSPLIWLSEYDILLRALTIQRNRLQDPWDDAINFADDLKSIGSSIHTIQEQLNLVSAFGLIFGLDQSRVKFKSILFPFGEHHTNSTQLARTVILRGPN